MPTPTEQPIRILIVDDHAILRVGLRMIFEIQPAFQVVGEACDGATALAAAAELCPDIILLDLELGDEISAALVPQLLAAAPDARVIVISGQRNVVAYRQAMLLGALGLVVKQQTVENLLRAIVAVQAGEVWIDRSIVANLIDASAGPPHPVARNGDATRIAALTTREREVIRLVGEGLKNKQIAGQLTISEATVRHHLSSIFGKLGVSDRFELVIYAYRHALADIPR